jgi:hypothetical protein
VDVAARRQGMDWRGGVADFHCLLQQNNHIALSTRGSLSFIACQGFDELEWWSRVLYLYQINRQSDQGVYLSVEDFFVNTNTMN